MRRVVRPPGYGAELIDVDTAAVEKMPGVVKVVRDGNFLAVVASKEYQAVKAMRALSAAAKWRETAKLPKQDNLPEVLTRLPSRDEDDLPARQSAAPARGRSRPSIRGPIRRTARSAPHAPWRNSIDGTMTVWTHTPGRLSGPRRRIAEMLRVPPASVR